MFAYCVNNPLKYIDPSGWFAWKAFWSTLGEVAAITASTALVGAAIIVFAPAIATAASLTWASLAVASAMGIGGGIGGAIYQGATVVETSFVFGPCSWEYIE